MKDRDNKKFLTVDEQIDYLRKEKKIIVNDDERYYFENTNYISLINPYKELFANGRDRNNNHIYINETKFSDFIKVLEIDNRFSSKLYNHIRDFERKFKNLVIIELCTKYNQIDLSCTKYVDEIRSFVCCSNEQLNLIEGGSIPKFCPNFYNIISKQGYSYNEDIIKARLDLLDKVYSIGTGKHLNNEIYKKNNQLTKHYLKTQQIVPLWVIQNCLTFGETTMLFSMLDFDAQKVIAQKMFNENLLTDQGTPNYKKLAKLNGVLEIIRNMRNTINHYEPIFPSFSSSIEKISTMNNSQYIKALKYLNIVSTKTQISHEETTTLNIDFNINRRNLHLIRILEFMEETAK